MLLLYSPHNWVAHCGKQADCHGREWKWRKRRKKCLWLVCPGPTTGEFSIGLLTLANGHKQTGRFGEQMAA